MLILLYTNDINDCQPVVGTHIDHRIEVHGHTDEADGDD